MIKLLGKIPRKCFVAVSGGVDSMAALDFLRRSHDVIALHYNHATQHADEAESLVSEYCRKHGVPLQVGKIIGGSTPKGVSKEAWWRENRYNFFQDVFNDYGATDRVIITCHHLDDVVENWVFTSMHGNPMLIPHHRDMYVRPFLTTRKRDLTAWCERKGVPWFYDPSNQDVAFRRNYIRHKMIEHAEFINPGIYKTMKKKYCSVTGVNNDD